MSTTEIKDKIVKKLESIEDASFLENILSYIDGLNDGDNVGNLSQHQINELDRRSASYFAGKEKLIDWQDIKKELQQNHGL